MPSIESGDVDAIDIDSVARLQSVQKLLRYTERRAQHPRRERRAEDDAQIEGGVQTTGVVGMGVREKVVAHVRLAKVEAVDDEGAKRWRETLDGGMLRRHGSRASERGWARGRRRRPPSLARSPSKPVSYTHLTLPTKA